MNRRLPVARVASALVAVLGMVGLIAVWEVGPAQADAPVDQITGNGSTASAVTVRWDQGIVGADNKTTKTPRPDASSAFGFMNADFQNLSVTVSQTESLVHQSIKVTWTGGKETQAPFREDFLQMMQCYGDADSGPTPEQCEFGSVGLLGANPPNAGIGTRSGTVCATNAPSTQQPPGGIAGTGPGIGCDPQEPTNGTHLDPTLDQSTYSVPFIPVDSTEKVYGHSTEFYDQFNSNEVQTANTGSDGTGQVFFQTLTATQASGLGCGLLEANGQPRGCWLVIVPRGEYEPNGYRVNPAGCCQLGFMNESPLGASAWAQRIQIHLNFDPLQPACPIGSAKERGTVGTELVSRAVFSWQLAINAAANCKTLYGYTTTPEATDTTQLADPTGAGLAFTTVPIGSEAARDGSPPTALPPLVYAPVTVSAMAFGFNVNEAGGFRDTPIKLTPRLVAKALTQSYRFDLPDVDNSHPGPDWAKKNPGFITNDPEFQALNPGVITPGSSSPLAPLLTQDLSGVNQQVWAWILADPAARNWLNGAPDENGMVVNPNYPPLVAKAAIDQFPRADRTSFNTADPGQPPQIRTSLDLLPYVSNYDDTASRVRAANNPEGATWDATAVSPSGSLGWWGRGGVEPAGQTFMWGLMDSANLANYGLIPADLCDSTGANCVSASTASVAAALASAKPDSTGLLHVNPGAPGLGGYPLVQVTYAAVRTTQDPAALSDYAALINYAVGQGQTAGVNPGQLPHGYLPLPVNLRAASQAAATRLLTIASATPTPTATGGTAPGGLTGGTGGAPAAPAAGVPPVAVNPAPSLYYSTTQVSAEPAAQTTTPTPVGAVRWALISVVVAGLVGSAGGPLLRVFFGSRATPWRRP